MLGSSGRKVVEGHLLSMVMKAVAMATKMMKARRCPSHLLLLLARQGTLPWRIKLNSGPTLLVAEMARKGAHDGSP